MAMKIMQSTMSRMVAAIGAACLVAGVAPQAGAQEIRSIDPNSAIDGDLASPQAAEPPAAGQPAYGSGEYDDVPAPQPSIAYNDGPAYVAPAAAQPAAAPATQQETYAATSDTYGEDDLIGAAEGVFGKGAQGLAKMIEDILKDQGQPNGYIVGREAGGALVVGARYGSGKLFHKVEGEMPVYWTGPSIGFDAGANAANTFVLVYNLYDTEELYERYPAGEGDAYFIGGMTASYLRKGDVVLIPIRVGAGLRLGINAGYMKFSKKQRWLPF
jgi:hypothetical protein